ncbi:MAG: aminoglycoside nucleotidyltransferase [Actinobacteria bacterium]|nr:aminoglycoside nucleotidyltransferase [Actinomycetota bacterium]
MSAEEVVHLLDILEAVGIDVWLDGGWGVDAVLETQSRPHDDLDLVVELGAVGALEALLARRGYRRVRGAAPMSFELTDDEGRQVDVHPVVFNESGDGIYRMESGEDWVYPAAGFAGLGYLAGRRVRCLTPEVQMLCHTGYEPHQASYDDVMALSRRFGIPVPKEYSLPPESYRPRTA